MTKFGGNFKEHGDTSAIADSSLDVEMPSVESDEEHLASAWSHSPEVLIEPIMSSTPVSNNRDHHQQLSCILRYSLWFNFSEKRTAWLKESSRFAVERVLAS